MKTVKAIALSAFLILGSVSQAHAMGDREQAALFGAGAVVILSALFGSSTSGSSDTEYEQTPEYYEPAPTIVYTQPYYAPAPTVVYRQPYQHVGHHKSGHYGNRDRAYVIKGYH